MKRRRVVLLSAAAIVVGLAAAALLIPLGSLRGPIEAAAGRALNRDVHITGSLHLAVFPELGVSLRNVSIANVAGAHDSQMVTVGKIVVGARLMPLLSGRLVVTKVILKQPVIHLEVGRDGIGNWQFGKRTNGVAADPFAPESLGIERVRIEDGEITYFDARTGKSQTLTDVSIALTRPKSSTPAAARGLSIDGTATYNTVPVKLAASLADFGGFVNGDASSAEVQLGSSLVDADFTGRLAAPGSLTGNLTLKAPSLRRLAAWAGESVPPGNGLGAIAVQAEVSAADGVYSLSKANISLDGMKLAGDVSIDDKAKVPTLKGRLAIDHVDVRPYLAPGNSEEIAKAAKEVGRDVPLALGGLTGIDADLTLTIGGVVLPDITLGRAVVTAGIHGGVLKAQAASLAAYGGTGKGSLTVDATGPVPSIHDVLDMSGIKVETFLGEVVGVTRISGSGTVHLDVTARGHTESEIVKALNGKGSVSIANGAIAGADLEAVSRVLQSTLTGALLTGAVGPNASTRFSTMAGDFTIQNGMVRTADLRMMSPAIEMTGSGAVNLASHAIDFHFEPRARQGIPGLGLVDIGIPFYVRGTWDNPSFGADPASVAKGIVGAVGGNVARLPGEILSVPGDALKSLFGGD